MKTTTREEMIEQARMLFQGTKHEENPEYFRGMCELINRCFPGENTDENLGLIEQAVLIAGGNLSELPEDWLKELFDSEYCTECGGDAQHHTAVPMMGNWFARCDYPPSKEDGTQHPVITEFRKGEFDEHY